MSFGFFGPFHQPTEEEIEQHKRQQERYEMQMDEFRHGHQRLFEELNEEQLTHLKTMMQIIAGGDMETGRALAASWEGQASMALKMRFNICVAHGVDHEKELQEEIDNEQK